MPSVARHLLILLQKWVGHLLDVVQGFLSGKNSVSTVCEVSPHIYHQDVTETVVEQIFLSAAP